MLQQRKYSHLTLIAGCYDCSVTFQTALLPSFTSQCDRSASGDRLLQIDHTTITRKIQGHCVIISLHDSHDKLPQKQSAYMYHFSSYLFNPQTEIRGQFDPEGLICAVFP